MLMRRCEFMRTGAMGLLAAPLASRDQTPLLGLTLRHVSPVVEIIPRSEWAGDLSPTGPLTSEEVRFLLVHHSASGNEYERDDVPALLRGFFEYHTSAEKGWHDIAYNFLIDRFGRVWEGRTGSTDGPIAGDATGGNQGYTQLVSLIGNFSSESPTPEALESLVSVLAWLADRYQVDTTPGATATFISRGSNRWPEGTKLDAPTIAGHRDMSLTECPGELLYAYVIEGLAADVTAFKAATLAATDITSSTTTTSATFPWSTTNGTVVTSHALTLGRRRRLRTTRHRLFRWPKPPERRLERSRLAWSQRV